MNQPEVDRLLANDPALRERIQKHLFSVARYGWDQVANARNDSLPVPVRGLATHDIWLGTVIVFPDEHGELFYSYPEGAPELQSLTAEINRLSYTSPDEGLIALINDLLRRLKELPKAALDISTVLALAAGLGFGIWLFAYLGAASPRRA